MGKVKNEWQDRDYVLKWFGKKEDEAKKNYRNYVKKEKVSIEELKAGSRCREASMLRAQIALGLVRTPGVSFAEVARQLGVSTSAVSKIITRANR